MERFSRFVLAKRRAIAALWVVLLLGGGWASSVLSKHLNQSFTIAGTPSAAASDALVAQYHVGGGLDPLVPVFVLPPGVTPEAARAKLEPALAAVPGRVVDYYNSGNRAFLGADGRTMFALVFTPAVNDQVKDAKVQTDAARVLPRRLAAAAPAGTQVHVTGITPLSSNGNGGGNGVLAEALLGAAGALIVLAFVFGSFLALLPLMIAAVSILSSYLVVLLLSEFMKVQAVVQYMVGLIGLGVAIDYSLLLVTRWREEVAHGADNETAVHRAMATAGRAVLVSGLTVALGLLSLIVVPIQFMRSIGIGGMLIPVVSVAVTLTLLPIALTGFGRRLDWPRLRHEDKPSRAWTAWARWVVRHRWIAAGLALLVLVPLAVAALGIHEGDPTTDSLAKSGDARQGLVALRTADIPSGVLNPYVVLTPPNTSGSQVTVSAISHGLYAAIAVTTPPPGTEKTPTTRWPMTVILPSDEAATSQGQHIAKLTRTEFEHAVPGTLVASSALANIDNIHKMYGQFPLLLAVLAILTFLVLARTFRSLLLPAKAVLANLLSVAAAYGGMVLIWQDGHGSHAIWGIPATGGIPFWIPMIVFAFLYGLSMDYEVFILSRMREEFDAGARTDDAVVVGLGRTGRLVTSAALILFLAFAALASAPSTFLKIFATGLGIGILLDATVVRALLVPALVSLFGRWNWVLPAWAARLLRVEPSP
ncbi:MmpL domain-containing protein [Catenulispora acidiphila DSM 44928]|uniref:MmpL domain-containing protein n=1 Tax=Catenulispora acidiphila (strain DSM 44928 / JCM 14897 / NBRC 102108 / NRRL B-24433 / ID139908) TaxID=479433 RepID=C7Q8E2_CATAD|nr:MMPL family transporter [Catenulispora acidiphila]ACU76130.1 MmpL domain-containing protein [Catenulispora acidiphila DSM 44928]